MCSSCIICQYSAILPNLSTTSPKYITVFLFTKKIKINIKKSFLNIQNKNRHILNKGLDKFSLRKGFSKTTAKILGIGAREKIGFGFFQKNFIKIFFFKFMIFHLNFLIMVIFHYISYIKYIL